MLGCAINEPIESSETLQKLEKQLLEARKNQEDSYLRQQLWDFRQEMSTTVRFLAKEIDELKKNYNQAILVKTKDIE